MDRIEAKNIIKTTVRTSIVAYASKSLNKKKKKFQILDLVIPKERKIRSIVGGLETAMGTTLWEPLARALARGNGFEVEVGKLWCPANMPAGLAGTLSSIIDDRKRNNGLYDAITSHNEIKRICGPFHGNPIDRFIKAPKGHGVDIWLKKDGVDYFFDTKTVQPNLRTLVGCMEQVLTWYAYYYAKKPNGNAFARIVFPYNPSPDGDFWQDLIGGGRPLERDNEGWVQDQFWNFCSGLDDTYTIITESFNELKNSGELEESLNILLNNHD
ncbi:MAG: TdeIII family type II restriction endonuclease [Pedobacter sp.]|nr:MAG: TdeIII family type II restriction endonuclease [Pedobacter sp.]